MKINCSPVECHDPACKGRTGPTCLHSSMRPRVDHIGLAPIKATYVPCSDPCAPRAGYSCDLAVRMVDGTASSASSGGYYGVGLGCRTVEGENATSENPSQQYLHSLRQPVPSSARWQNLNTIPQLSLIDGRGVKVLSALAGDPIHNFRVGTGAHKLRDDVGVQENH